MQAVMMYKNIYSQLATILSIIFYLILLLCLAIELSLLLVFNRISKNK